MKYDKDFDRFSETLTAMAEIYKKKLTTFQVEMYWGDLEMYSWDQFTTAATHIRRSHIYNTFPLVAVFVQEIDPPENRDALAVEALRRYRELMTRYGAGQSIVLADDPAMACTVNALGGWIKVGCEERDSFQASQFERDFRKMYAYHLERKTKPKSLHLMGYFERDNRINGYLKPDNTDFDGLPWYPIYIEGTTTLNLLPNGNTTAPVPAIEQAVLRQISAPIEGRLEKLARETMKKIGGANDT